MDRKRIRGIQAILPTPYKDDLEIDYNDLEKCVEFCAASSVHGIVTTVNASEFQLLSENERKEVIKTVCKRADGRMPVMAGITGKTVQETLTYAKCAKEYGAQSVIAMPPYVSHIKEEEIYEFYRRLNEEADITVVIQNFVGPVGTEMSVDLLLRMTSDFENIQYIKEETERAPQMISKILERTKEFPDAALSGVLGGMSGRQVIQEFYRGACGCMPACLVADVLVKLWNALENGEKDLAEELYAKLLPIIVYDGVYPIIAYKEVLKRRGVIKNSCTRLGAWGRLDQENHRELTKILETLEPYFTENWENK